MEKRLKLQIELETLLGSKRVYFQPPPSISLRYPCIIYKRTTGETNFADNKPYTYGNRYAVTVITKDPDSDIPDRLAKHFPMCLADRFFQVDNLNHYIFNLYY